MLKKLYNRFGSISRMKFYYQRSVIDYSKREKISNRIAKKNGKTSFEGTSIIKSEYQNGLATKGYINLGVTIDEKKIQIIKNSLKSLKCFDPFRPIHGEFEIDKTPNDVHVANYKREDLLQITEILEIANDPTILNLAQDFLGSTPLITNINCWWSFANKKEAEDAQFFHRDVDDYRFCKIFLYLTDVGINDGPHVFVEGSPSSNTLTKIRRYKDDEIINEFTEEKIKYFTGKKGSMFMVNTYGFHKGLLPKDNNRLLLQIQYSLNPIGIESYSPIVAKNHKYNSKVNQLILKK